MEARMLLGLGGGLCLFLVGIRFLSLGIRRAAGDRLYRLVGVLTTNPLLGVVTGAVVTSITQSSSAVTVVVVGLVDSGAMNLAQATGVIMGANIGTTITAQLIAFRFTGISLPAVLLGLVLLYFSRHRAHEGLGLTLLGIGSLFYGIELMSGWISDGRVRPWLSAVILAFGENELACLLIGALGTAIIQSSSATIGLLQVMANRGIIGIGTALPVMLGADIGTTSDTLLASVGLSKNAKRAAAIHLIFNVVGSVVFLMALPLAVRVVTLSSDDPMRQVANAHLLFNLMSTVIMLPFLRYLVRASVRLIP